MRMRRKVRLIKNNTLFAGEGSDDVKFLNHIKTLYMIKGKRIKIVNGTGGSPISVIEKMVKRPEFFDYERKYALLDDDREEITEAIEYAEKVGVNIITSETCLEFEQLRLLGVRNKIMNRIKRNSKLAKEEFHKYMSGHSYDFDKIFPYDLLDNERQNNAWLDKIIRVFEEL